eukprot:4193414-Amphidinium_carterae.1
MPRNASETNVILSQLSLTRAPCGFEHRLKVLMKFMAICAFWLQLGGRASADFNKAMVPSEPAASLESESFQLYSIHVPTNLFEHIPLLSNTAPSETRVSIWRRIGWFEDRTMYCDFCLYCQVDPRGPMRICFSTTCYNGYRLRRVDKWSGPRSTDKR